MIPSTYRKLKTGYCWGKALSLAFTVWEGEASSTYFQENNLRIALKQSSLHANLIFDLLC